MIKGRIVNYDNPALNIIYCWKPTIWLRRYRARSDFRNYSLPSVRKPDRFLEVVLWVPYRERLVQARFPHNFEDPVCLTVLNLEVMLHRTEAVPHKQNRRYQTVPKNHQHKPVHSLLSLPIPIRNRTTRLIYHDISLAIHLGGEEKLLGAFPLCQEDNQ